MSDWHYWDLVLHEVTEQCEENIRLFTVNAKFVVKETAKTRYKRQNIAEERIWLGANYPKIYLTRREGQTIRYMMLGKTIKEMAELMKLSMRTVEYYVRNIKSKLSCRTRSELIGAIVRSDFMKTWQQLEETSE